MPDHVRHPDKYTCYVLDEPLVVGGGDKGANVDGGRTELEKVRTVNSLALRPGVASVLSMVLCCFTCADVAFWDQ